MDLNASIPTIVDSSSLFAAFCGQLHGRTEDVKRSLSLICGDKQRNLVNQLMDNFFMGSIGDLHQDLMIWKKEEEQNTERAYIGRFDDGTDDDGEMMTNINNGRGGQGDGSTQAQATPREMFGDGPSTSQIVNLPHNRRPRPKRYSCTWPQCAFGCQHRCDLGKHLRNVHFKLGASTSARANITWEDYIQEVPQTREELWIQQQREEEESSFLPGFRYQHQQANQKPTFLCPSLGCAKVYYSKNGLDYHRRTVHRMN